jgi:hypothetical protein
MPARSALAEFLWKNAENCNCRIRACTLLLDFVCKGRLETSTELDAAGKLLFALLSMFPHVTDIYGAAWAETCGLPSPTLRSSSCFHQVPAERCPSVCRDDKIINLHHP